jgi:hypothetical protein
MGLLFLCGLMISICVGAPIASAEKTEVGWVEKVRLTPGNLIVHAKIDTGAKNSSLNAYDIDEFSRNGEKWVRFTVTNRDGESATFERKVVRTAKIKRRSVGSVKNPQRHERPVIKLGLCIGNVYGEVEVNLADRRRFNYQMLVGRSFMNGRTVVDSSKKYTMEPQCGVEKNVE